MIFYSVEVRKLCNSILGLDKNSKRCSTEKRDQLLSFICRNKIHINGFTGYIYICSNTLI